MVSIPGIITYMTKVDAMGPIIALEATVTGGRTLQAYKRGGKDEARERVIEEGTGAVVWLGGVKFLNFLGDKVLERIFGAGFDVGTDNVLRTPFKNFLKSHPNLKISPNAIAGIKAAKVLSSVLLADAFIGLVVPPLNQRLTRNLRKKESERQDKYQDKLELNKQENKSNTSFKGALSAINKFTNAIENTNTGKLLSTDAGLVSGRMYSARNNDERREIAIRDIGSIYFYMWAQNHVCNVLNFAESGRLHRLDPQSAKILDESLNKLLKETGELSVEDFKKSVLGNRQASVLPEGVEAKLEFEKLSKFDEFLNRFRKTPKEPLKVIKVSELEKIITDEALLNRIREMSKLQPLREGEAVITKQQILDSINNCKINDPELLDKVFTKFTEGKSKAEFGFVSNKKLYNLKQYMEDYIDDLCKMSKDGKITEELLKKAKNKNLALSFVNFVAGFGVAALFLSTLIPKFQYWVTRQKTGKDLFPGVYEEDIASKNKA